MGGGHCNELFTEEVEGVVLIEGASYMASYARVEIALDPQTNEILQISHEVKHNVSGVEDLEVAQVVAYWQSERDIALSDVIGYTNNEINRYSPAMYNMVTDAWLYSYPTADISMTNTGGIRQSIPSGDISLATIVGLLPFENTIVEVELTGTELIDCILRNIVIGGMTTVDGYYHSDGTPLVADSVYLVLTTDYLYSIPEYNFSLYDPTPYRTSIHYRQPVIDWIESLNTSPSDPLTNYLDHTPRR
jgi:2',3'-cyclic-nucleotide 2'-phosphodiesterase (5'-nucleotidase family)